MGKVIALHSLSLIAQSIYPDLLASISTYIFLRTPPESLV